MSLQRLEPVVLGCVRCDYQVYDAVGELHTDHALAHEVLEGLDVAVHTQLELDLIKALFRGVPHDEERHAVG